MPAEIIWIDNRPLELNARPDRLDLRDRPYSPPLTPLQDVFPTADDIRNFLPLYQDLILDQGKDGACTGYGLAAVINYQFWFRDVVLRRTKPEEFKDQVSARMLYQMARLYDEWDGEDYSGSSCRGAMRGWYHHGVCLEETWPYKNAGHLFEDYDSEDDRNKWLQEAAKRPLGAYYRISGRNIPDMQAAIQQVHAIYVSARVHDGWTKHPVTGRTETDNKHMVPPLIHWHDKAHPAGVHAFAIVGYNRQGFILQNSWGKSWGNRGFAVLSYGDWLVNGLDAWASVYGARTEMVCAPKTKSSGSLQTSAVRTGAAHASTDTRGARQWDNNIATLHTVVMGKNGRAMSRLVHAEDGREHLLICAEKRVLRHCAQPHDFDHLVIYAHGGLADEAATLRRSAVLGPWFKANRIYPIFLSSTSGHLDDLGSLFRDAVVAQKQKMSGRTMSPSEMDRQIKATNDYTWEAIASGVTVRAIWTEVKENAALAAQADGALYLLARHIRRLRTRYPELKVHLVGHSAGAHATGHLLDQLRRIRQPVDSATLWAPACSMRFAHRIFGKALQKGVVAQDRFAIEVLDEKIELQDGIAGLYRKSFLYLVSRALERAHKTPLLGLQSSWQVPDDSDVMAWREIWGAGKEPFVISSPDFDVATVDSDRGSRRARTSHGGFDRSTWQVESAIERMLGRAPDVPVTDLSEA